MLNQPAAATFQNDENLAVLPVLLAECLIQRFTFWLGGGLRCGMRYEDDLYELAYEFNAQSRSEAFQTACALLHHRVAALVTSGSERYTVWVSVRSQSYQHWAEFKAQPSFTKLPAKPKAAAHLNRKDIQPSRTVSGCVR